MDTTEAYVKYIFNMAGVGMPYRVDFTPCGKVSGFKEDNRSSAYKSAFVHFHLFYDGAGSVISFEGLLEGMFQTVEYEPYWRILKNRNPVSTTMMNNHQIVANCCVLEEKVAKCCALEEKVAQLERERDCYCDTFDLMSSRITMLEKNLYKLADIVLDKSRLRTEDDDLSEKIECENLDSESVSTHSSMPSLESAGPTEEEIASAYEDDVEEEDVTDLKIQYLNQASDHLDEVWLERAIEIVETRLNSIRSTNTNVRERILSTTNLCGNE